MSEATMQALRDAIGGLHGGDRVFVESIPVRMTFQRRTAGEGAVGVLDLMGHPTATRAYARSVDVPGTNRRRFVAVLHAGPVNSPVHAVRASIVADRRGRS